MSQCVAVVVNVLWNLLSVKNNKGQPKNIPTEDRLSPFRCNNQINIKC